MPQSYKEKLLIKRIQNNRQIMAKKYMKKSDFYSKVINDIIYNEKSSIVAMFKDYLILDDTSEFLKRFYKKSEIATRLSKIFNFYESYSKIFPNYTKIKESKYLYKNIQKKQKMIDNINKGLKVKKELDRKKKANEKLFDTKIYNSILNHTNQSNKLKANESHAQETNTSFENLINNIQDAERKSSLELECIETLRLRSKMNSVNEKSRLFMTKEKISINEFPNEGKTIITSPLKEDKLHNEIEIKSSKYKHKTLHMNKLEITDDLTPNKATSKSIKNSAKTERRESKTLKDLKNDIPLKNPNSKILEPKIINNYNIINNVQNIIQAPPLILSATASSEVTKDVIKYNSNNNSMMNTIQETNIASFKSINGTSYKLKYKSSKSSSTKSSHDFTNFNQKFNIAKTRPESINRNQMKKLIYKEVIDMGGLQSDRNHLVNVLTKRESKNEFLSMENNKGQVPLIRGKSKDFATRQLVIKETNDVFKNLAFKNVPLKDVLLSKKVTTKDKINDTNSPNSKLSILTKNSFGTMMFKSENSKFYFNKNALKINNLLGTVEKNNVHSDRKHKVNF